MLIGDDELLQRERRGLLPVPGSTIQLTQGVLRPTGEGVAVQPVASTTLAAAKQALTTPPAQKKQVKSRTPIAKPTAPALQRVDTPFLDAYRAYVDKHAQGVGTPEERALIPSPPLDRPRLDMPAEELAGVGVPLTPDMRPRRVLPLPPAEPPVQRDRVTEFLNTVPTSELMKSYRQRAMERIGPQKRRGFWQVLKDIGTGLAGAGLGGAILGGIKGGDYRYMNQLQQEMADLQATDAARAKLINDMLDARTKASQQEMMNRYYSGLLANQHEDNVLEAARDKHRRVKDYVDALIELQKTSQAQAGSLLPKTAKVYNPLHRDVASALRQAYEKWPDGYWYKREADPTKMKPMTEDEVAAAVRAEADKLQNPFNDADIRNLRNGMEVADDVFYGNQVYSKDLKRWMPIQEYTLLQQAQAPAKQQAIGRQQELDALQRDYETAIEQIKKAQIEDKLKQRLLQDAEQKYQESVRLLQGR